MLKRILSVFGANIFGQIITIVIQVVSVPLFLHFWGSLLFGEWLILTALPSYLIVSGTGIGFVSGNTMQKHFALGENQEALGVFQSAWLITILLSVFLLLIIVPVVFFFPISEWMEFVHIGEKDTRLTLVILTVYILLTLQTELFSGAYRASGRLDRSVTFLNILRFAEFLGVVAIVSFGGESVSASIVYLLVRVLGVVWMMSDLKKITSLRLGIEHASRSVIRSELGPTFSFLGFPLGNACLIQGMTTVVGMRLGANAVVVFSVIRTLTGFVKQFSSAVQYSVWPEFSVSLSTGKLSVARNLHRTAFQVAFIFSSLGCVALYVFGDWIISIWTGGKVSIDKNLFFLMLVSAVPNVLWNLSSYVSISINRHANIAFVYLIAAASSMLIAYLLIPYFGLLAVPVATILSDIFTLYFVLTLSFKIVQDRARDFFAFMVSNVPFKLLISNKV